MKSWKAQFPAGDRDIGKDRPVAIDKKEGPVTPVPQKDDDILESGPHKTKSSGIW